MSSDSDEGGMAIQQRIEALEAKTRTLEDLVLSQDTRIEKLTNWNKDLASGIDA